jgi:hypothetical protein
MVRMAEAGATVPQIASVSGHSIEATQRILETYLPRNRDLAEVAIARLAEHKVQRVGQKNTHNLLKNNGPCSTRCTIRCEGHRDRVGRPTLPPRQGRVPDRSARHVTTDKRAPALHVMSGGPIIVARSGEGQM